MRKRPRNDSQSVDITPAETNGEDAQDDVDCIEDDEILDKGELVTKAGVTSWVWEYFKVWSKLPNNANCNICSKDIKFISAGKVSTSKLDNHLKSVHPEIVRTRLEKLADKEISTVLAKPLTKSVQQRRY